MQEPLPVQKKNTVSDIINNICILQNHILTLNEEMRLLRRDLSNLSPTMMKNISTKKKKKKKKSCCKNITLLFVIIAIVVVTIVVTFITLEK
jgi:hypothetical protein